MVVEERPLREIISASSKLSPVKKDLTFDKNEMHLLKLMNSGNDKSSWLNNGVITTGQVSKKSMTLSGIVAKGVAGGQMKEIPGDIGEQPTLISSDGAFVT